MFDEIINKDIIDNINKFTREIIKHYNIIAVILFGSYSK